MVTDKNRQKGTSDHAPFYRTAACRADARRDDRLRREGISRDIREEVKLFQSLSEREEKICRLTIQGFVSRAIGERLEISHRTVEHYRGSALKKLGLHSSADLAQFFARVDAFLAANPER